MIEQRLDRQLRIKGWDQKRLRRAKVGVVGDDDLLASLYVMSASALGINDLVVIAPVLDKVLNTTAAKVNPRINMTHIEGFYTHPVMDDIFTGCNLIVDLSQYGLANKLLLEKGSRDDVPIIRGFCYEQGFKVFTYMKGREWKELELTISPKNLPDNHFDDGVLGIIAAGIVLEETKNILMNHKVSEEVISYKREKLNIAESEPKILVVGAGALGVFAGLGLAYSKFDRVTFMDPDVTDMTNLNRQVLLYDAVGESKAETLSRRLDRFFEIETDARVEHFKESTDISAYDAVFDCVDNFETRIIMSEKCKAQKKILISGGTSISSGQVVIYNPVKDDVTPAELLGMYDIVDERGVDVERQEKASCTYQPDPSVIMTNQIIGGAMVDAFRMLLSGQEPGNIFYDSTGDERI